MKLFVNDRYINILSDTEFESHGAFDLEISPDIPLSSVKLEGHVLIWNGNSAYIDSLITLMEVRKLKRLQMITFVTPNYEEVKEFVKSQFKIIKAAGGLIVKGERYLVMLRNGVWDLPKGKLDKGEKTKAGAVREVEEECGISVEVEGKITSTWHTYVQDGRKILKKTTWYLMYCTNDRNMRPQVEENIVELRWMDRQEIEIALQNSYRSIQEVYASYTRIAVED